MPSVMMVVVMMMMVMVVVVMMPMVAAGGGRPRQHQGADQGRRIDHFAQHAVPRSFEKCFRLLAPQATLWPGDNVMASRIVPGASGRLETPRDMVRGA